MTRPLSPVWLALSVIANAALLGICLTRESKGPDEPPRAAEPVSETKRATIDGTVDVSGLAPEVVARIGAGDEATLRDLLLACGMEPKTVRRLVASAVGGRFEAERVAAMMRQRGTGWWKEQPNWWSYPEREAIAAREEAEIERLMGDWPDKQYPWQTERWNFLPAEKLAALHALDRDYEELEKKLPPEPWLPSEREMFEALLKEKRRDLETALSVEELEEYDFRDKADVFARNLDKYGITDAELRAIWRADKEREKAVRELEARYGKPNRDPFSTEGSSWPPEAREAERRLDEAYEARKTEILSAERIARGDREANYTFKGIVKVTEKFGLGRERAETVYAVIDQSKAIINAEDLDDDDQEKLKKAVWLEISEQMPPDALPLLKSTLGVQLYWLMPSEE